MKELEERITEAVIGLGCSMNEENVNEVRDAIRVLADCKAILKSGGRVLNPS